MHFYSTLVRGLGKAAPSANFQEVLENLWWRLDRKLSLDDVEMSARVILVDAIRKGTTTLVDHHASPGAVRGSLGRIARAVKDSGLRSCLCYEVSDRDGDAVSTRASRRTPAFARECAAGHDPQLRALFGLHAAFTLSDETLERASRMGRDLGDRLPRPRRRGGFRRRREPEPLREDARASGSSRTGSSAREASPPTPSTWTTRTPTALAASGAWVVHNPQSNLNNAVGIADVVGLVRRGIPVGLGTDAMTVGMLEELRVGLWAQHLRQDEPELRLHGADRRPPRPEPRDRLAALGVPHRDPRRRGRGRRHPRRLPRPRPR